MSSLADRLEAKFAHVEHDEIDMHVYRDMALNFLVLNPFSALFVDTGLGKTIILLSLIAKLILEEKVKRVLIVAPVRVAKQTWPNEIGEWQHTAFLNATVLRVDDDDPRVLAAGQAAYDAFKERPDEKALRQKRELEAVFAVTPEEKMALRSIPTREQARQKAETWKKDELRNALAEDGCTIHIINREALVWLINKYTKWEIVGKKKGVLRKKRVIVDWPYDCVIIDESSGFKDHSAARFKALLAVRVQGFITRMHQLTATPAAEGYMGLFAQIFLLDLGQRLGKNITAYREAYFVPGYKGHYSTKLRPGAEDEISDKIADICLVMKSEDYLDEKPPLFLPRRIRMTETERKQYRRFARDFILTLEDGEEIEAETAASLSSKLLQLASGAVYTKDREVRHIHDHKIEDLRQLQEELGEDQPILVAYWYQSSLARLKAAFPEAVVMDSEGKVAARHGPWNSGKIKMLLVHPASVAFGLNMQHGPGHDVYMFDACWSYELYYQLYRRLHRQGQKQRVRVHQAQLIGTNDELVFKRLDQKEDAQDYLFEWIKRWWAKSKEPAANDDEWWSEAA